MASATPSTTEYKVDRALWESLESVFQMRGRAYVRELARRLEVDEKELTRRVFGPTGRCVLAMTDAGLESTSCTAFIRTGTVVHHCRRPVQTGSPFCPCHQTVRPNVVESASGVIELRKLADAADRESLWVDSDGTVINCDGAIRGTYDSERGRLRLFIVG
jgi:hypothetical protein